MTHRIVLVLMLLILSFTAAPASEGNGRAMLFQVDGVIGPATVDYLSRGFQHARDEGSSLIILQMNTPGGLDDAMRSIIRDIIASPIPVVTYVSPGGSRAASAGTYILYASHVAAMAPGTNLGAATPVQMGGAPEAPQPSSEEEGDEDSENGEEERASQPGTAMERKMINDAVAYIRSLADMRGRNADWAEKAVRDAVSLGAREALEQNVIDNVADDLDELLMQIDGREVRVSTGTVSLDTAELELVRMDPDWRNEFLSIITNPNVAYILMLIGIYGIIFELANPGSIVPGVLGGICLLVALFAFQALPINYAGAALMLLGVALMAAEAFVPSFGILGIGGIVSFALGSLLLIDTGVEAYEISLSLVIGVSAVSFMVVFGIAAMALKSHRRQIVSGPEQMLGSTAVAASDFAHGVGKVHLYGELWNARAAVAVSRGQTVRVTALDGLWLSVEPVEDVQD
ncbi:MAG: nodulation protein NfeD [Aquisalimonadaceae bacterium]